jgi:hypothetical protein
MRKPERKENKKESQDLQNSSDFCKFTLKNVRLIVVKTFSESSINDLLKILCKKHSKVKEEDWVFFKFCEFLQSILGEWEHDFEIVFNLLVS